MYPYVGVARSFEENIASARDYLDYYYRNPNYASENHIQKPMQNNLYASNFHDASNVQHMSMYSHASAPQQIQMPMNNMVHKNTAKPIFDKKDISDMFTQLRRDFKLIIQEAATDCKQSASLVTKDGLAIPVIQKPATKQSTSIEKSANISSNAELVVNPCKDGPSNDVVGQDRIQLSQAEIVDPQPCSKIVETISSTSTLGGQQHKNIHHAQDRFGSDRSELKNLPVETEISDFASENLDIGPGIKSENKYKLKMLKPKKPEIGV
ncbi:unnamed protein product [Urochloa humidicola]